LNDYLLDETIAQEKKVKVGFFATASFSFSVSCYKTIMR